MQGFKCIFYTPDEAAQIIAHCEERLIKAKIITSPFSATEIQGGILKEHLTDEDYLAPHKVGSTDCHNFQIFMESYQLKSFARYCPFLYFPARRTTGGQMFGTSKNCRTKNTSKNQRGRRYNPTFMIFLKRKKKYLMTLHFIKQLHSSLIILLTEFDEDEGEYIAEDQETEARRNRKTAQRVQTSILQNLRQSLGAAATLPEEAAKDLILQVT